MEFAGITIRPAAPREDDALLRDLAARLTTFGLPRWRTAREIADAEVKAMIAAVLAADRDSEVFVAERGGVPVGCLHVLVDVDFFGRRHAHISVVAVAAAAEGSGVGRALMAHADQWARMRDLSLVTLNVFAENGRARRLYEHVGFEPELVKYVKLLG